MAFIPTNRAFRFNVGSKSYALDLQNEGIVYGLGVHLFVETPSGWFRVHQEMEPFMKGGDSDINAAGGIVPFCRLIVEKVNKALKILQGETGEIPPGTTLQEKVLDHLRANLSVTYVNGIAQLVLK